MRDSIKEAVATTVTDMLNTGLKVSFTQKELNELGIEIEKTSISHVDIKNIRTQIGVSQAVFAKLLNISISTVRQWEQGVRKPNGSTMVLLELLQKNPMLLNYRLDLNVA